MLDWEIQEHFAVRCLTEYCKAVGSEYAHRVIGKMESHDWRGIADLDIDPCAYHNSTSFAYDYAIYAWLRKYEAFPVTEDLEKKAVSTYERVEQECRETNYRLSKFGAGNGVEGIISDARRKVTRLLGRFSFSKVLPGCEWGPGATATIPRRLAALDKKILESRLSVSSSALRYAKAYLSVDFHWQMSRYSWRRLDDVHGSFCPLDSEFTIEDGARWTTVPKTVKQRRSISIEPTMNLFLQKGVGRYIRRRLQTVGIDLDDQSRNQRLAERAQYDGLATIDLSNASDSISRKVVELLLPDDWFEYLNDIRTKFVEIGGSRLRIEKFSAMGNGFTFELESLIFWSLCDSIRERVDDSAVVSVYGDDLIVSRQLVDVLFTCLRECGFTVNKEKSFVDGPFFESCGFHYFNGVDVTPLFQKECISTAPSVYRAANRIIRLAARMGRGAYLDSKLLRPVTLLWNSEVLGAAKRHWGPLWLEGDGFLIDPYFRPKADRDGIFRITEIRETQPKRKLRCDGPLLATALRRGVVCESPFMGQLALHGETRVTTGLRRVYVASDDSPVWGSTLNAS